MQIIEINIYDVIQEGSIEAAIISECERLEIFVATPAATGGQTFATSGPGPGWTKQFDEDDYALAAINADMAYGNAEPEDCEVLNPKNGRVASGIRTDDDIDIQWSSESYVNIVVPKLEDAVEHPQTVSDMVSSVIDYHKDKSDIDRWSNLIRGIRELEKALYDIDIDELKT